MDKFNLTFDGKIVDGFDLAEVKKGFAEALLVTDSERVEQFFSGEAVTIRRNLEKDAATAFYTKMYRVGAVLKLEPSRPKPVDETSNPGMQHEFRKERPGTVDQSWPIPSSNARTKKTPPPLLNKPGNAVKQAEEKERKQADEEHKRIRDQESARIEAKRIHREAEALAAKRRAAEDAAKVRAEEKRKRDEQAARAKAEHQRIKAEETAKRKAQALVAKKKAAEALDAKKKADEEAAIQAALDEIARKKVEEEAAVQQALALAARKRAKEEEAKLREQLAAQKRKNSLEAARAKADEERIENALRTLAEKRKADETNRNSSLEEDKQQLELEEAQKRQQRLAQEKVAERRAQDRQIEQAALQRAATGGKRQAGAPNLFNLKPFRNTAEIRQRAASSLHLMKVMYIASVVALLTLLILGARYVLLPIPEAGVTHADKIIANQYSALFIAAGKELFVLDRSGTDNKRYRFADLGVDSGSTLLDFDNMGRLLIQGSPAASTDDDSSAQRLLRCDLQLPKCEAFAAELPSGKVSDWITDMRTGDSFVAIAEKNSLSRLAQDGSLISQHTVVMSSGVKLAFHEGLLYMNSSTGPAIGIFRPDAKGFGEQLDDILLLPQQAQKHAHTRVNDFLLAADSWWVIMSNPDTHSSALYRFDTDWKYLSTIVMEPQSVPQQLLSWSNKILVVDSTRLDIARFSAEGQAELPLTPTALVSDITRKQTSLTQSRRLWYACLGFLALLGIAAYVLGRLHQLRALVYKPDNVRGAAPIDDKINAIRWIELDRRKNAAFKQLVALLATITVVVLGTLIDQVAPINVVIAAIIFFSGPAIALTLMTMSRPGHLGILEDKLILVDHNNNYHIDGGPRIHYRNNFLLMDDIVVYVGDKLLPVFSTEKLSQYIAPLARAGVKVDRKTVLVKLAQSSHPLTRGLIAFAACFGGALFCLLLY